MQLLLSPTIFYSKTNRNDKKGSRGKPRKPISAPPFRFASCRSRAFTKCPPARKNSHLQASLQWLFITRFHALISLLSRRLLDDCSNSTRTYCSTTFTVQIVFTYIVKSLFYAVLLNLYFEKIVPKCPDHYGSKVTLRSHYIY